MSRRCRIESMPAPRRPHRGMQGPPRQRKIAHEVENLVSHTFIGPPQRVVDRPFVGEDQQITMADRQPQPRGLEPLGLLDGEKRAGGRQLCPVGSRRHLETELLPTDRGMTVVKLVVNR